MSEELSIHKPNIGFVFPGQGSQAVGMGQALAENFAVARQVFEEVDEALSFSLSGLIKQGPLETLTLTEHAQPAIMACSIACWRVLEAELNRSLALSGRYAAGHSLGEYSALAAMGVLSLADTARLLQLRGRSMQQSVPAGEGAMAALIGVTPALVEEIIKEAAQNDVLAAANDNGGGQIVISGKAEAVTRAMEIAKAKGVKRALPLPVSAPFHCALMEPAVAAMSPALKNTSFRPPSLPIINNVTAIPEDNPSRLRDHLVSQICGQVRWRESVEYMANQSITLLLELGNGKVLSGLAKRIDERLEGQAFGEPAQLDGVLRILSS